MTHSRKTLYLKYADPSRSTVFACLVALLMLGCVETLRSHLITYRSARNMQLVEKELQVRDVFLPASKEREKAREKASAHSSN